ncbi:MAG: SPASM domain-containing protein [Magnetococcales bacterium]|nr:SPASM domain-containing protein [Magnetococcales bacterium]
MISTDPIPDRGLEITTRIGCRLSCQYCPQSVLNKAYSKRQKKVQMDLTDFIRCLESVPSEVQVYFAGYAEPWLNPACLDMVTHTARKGHALAVTTTLVGMSPADILALEKIERLELAIHLPAVGERWEVLVDTGYLNTLNTLLESPLAKGATFRFHGRKLHPRIQYQLGSQRAVPISLTDRAGNITVTDHFKPVRKFGVIGCNRIYRNVLLPNGDVALCCMDYDLSTILGNLLTDGYEALFTSEPFKTVLESMKNSNIDSLCRHCEYASNIDMTAKIFNRNMAKVRRIARNTYRLLNPDMP